MCGGDLGQLVNKTVGAVTGGGGTSAPAPVIGQPETAKTAIGDSGSAVVQRRKPRSLLSGAALGDTSAAPVTVAGAKPTLGG